MWAIQNVILAVTSAISARIVMRSEAIDGDKIVEESLKTCQATSILRINVEDLSQSFQMGAWIPHGIQLN